MVGLPDEKVGERIKARWVFKKDIKGITGCELIKYCRQLLVSCKIFQHIEFGDMLPKSTAGKLLRREIRGEGKRMKKQSHTFDQRTPIEYGLSPWRSRAP